MAKPSHWQHIPATISLITACFLLFIVVIIIQEIIAPELPPPVVYYFAGGVSITLIQKFEWYRIFTAIFIHSGFFHFTMNMIALYMGGAALELLIRSSWFLGIFLLSGISGSIFSVCFNEERIISVGASGGIMGIYAALAIASYSLPRKDPYRKEIQETVVRVLVPSLMPLASGIDYAGHFGGAIMGGIASFLLFKASRCRTEFGEILLPHSRAIKIFNFMIALITIGAFSYLLTRFFFFPPF